VEEKFSYHCGKTADCGTLAAIASHYCGRIVQQLRQAACLADIAVDKPRKITDFRASSTRKTTRRENRAPDHAMAIGFDPIGSRSCSAHRRHWSRDQFRSVVAGCFDLRALTCLRSLTGLTPSGSSAATGGSGAGVN
jgi:hypothetical protein